jgi:excinuclease UvrABC nuclease subunit
VLELDGHLEFDPVRDAEFFSALPQRPAVCLLLPRDPAAEPLLIRTADLRRRLQRLLGPPDPASKRLNLREIAGGVRYRLTGSTFEQSLTYYQHARKLLPARYRDLMRLRAPAVLKLSLRSAYPRCYVTRRVSPVVHGAIAGGACYGPFPSRRAALAFAERVLDLFKVRRCQIKIRRDPQFPGCLYSEMKMCLAPCFAGCTQEEYDAEVARLEKFLDSNGGSLRAAIEQEREQASQALDFERAAALHKRLEKVDAAYRGHPDLIRRLPEIHALILQHAAEPQTVAAFPVRGGRIAEPFFLRLGGSPDEAQAAEQFFRRQLGEETVPEQSAELGEHLSLLARWFYAHPRQGEILFRGQDWPYRRILRACARLLKEKETAGGETQP